MRGDLEYVYLIKCYSWTKIGVSKDVDRRLRNIDSPKLPQEPFIIAHKETRDAYSLESEIHEEFFSENTRGEWFSVNLENIEKIISKFGFECRVDVNEYYSNENIEIETIVIDDSFERRILQEKLNKSNEELERVKYDFLKFSNDWAKDRFLLDSLKEKLKDNNKDIDFHKHHSRKLQEIINNQQEIINKLLNKSNKPVNQKFGRIFD